MDVLEIREPLKERPSQDNVIATEAPVQGNPDLDAVEALAKSLESGARFKRSLSVYALWPDGGRKQPRTLDKAREIGLAIAGISGAEMKVLQFGDSREGSVHVDIGNTEISIFYEERPEEAAQS